MSQQNTVSKLQLVPLSPARQAEGMMVNLVEIHGFGENDPLVAPRHFIKGSPEHEAAVQLLWIQLGFTGRAPGMLPDGFHLLHVSAMWKALDSKKGEKEILSKYVNDYLKGLPK